MSKIGKKIISIPQGVTVKIENDKLEARGKEGTIVLPILPNLNVEIKENQLSVKPLNDERQTRASWGTMRALIQNAVTGVNAVYTKELEIQGVGYRAVMEGTTLVLNVGFTHQVKFPSPEGVKIAVEKSLIKLSGINKHTVGQAAAQIRLIKKPEPYKGKGIRYKGEYVKQKAGKKVAGATAAA